MKTTVLSAIFLALLAALLLAGVALAAPPGQQPTPTDNEVNAIAKQLYCPVCENTPLDVCPTQACAEWRELIRDKLAEGYTEAEIKQYFVDYYGARVLAAPPAQGFNWLAYIVPPVAILAGAFLLYRTLRSWKRPLPQPSAQVAGAGDEVSRDEYIARLEEELRKR